MELVFEKESMPITPEEFAKLMKHAVEIYSGDKELRHIRMDILMCNMLIMLGYGEGVKIFEETKKWYA